MVEQLSVYVLSPRWSLSNQKLFFWFDVILKLITNHEDLVQFPEVVRRRICLNYETSACGKHVEREGRVRRQYMEAVLISSHGYAQGSVVLIVRRASTSPKALLSSPASSCLVTPLANQRPLAHVWLIASILLTIIILKNKYVWTCDVNCKGKAKNI